MEIAFFPVPEMKTEVSSAPTACCSDEFSFLLAAMLNAVHSGAPLETRPVETSDDSVPVDGAPDKDIEARPEQTEKMEVKEGGIAGAENSEALFKALPNEHDAFLKIEGDSTVAVEIQEGRISSSEAESSEAPLKAFFNGSGVSDAPSEEYNNTGLSQQPLTVPLNGGQSIRETIVDDKRAAVHEAVASAADLNAQKNLPDRAGSAVTEKGMIELAGISRNGAEQEHFEMEIPAEEIMKRSVIEPKAGPAIAASFAPDEVPGNGSPVALEKAPVELFEYAGKTEKGSVEEVRVQQAGSSEFTFQGAEGQERDGEKGFGEANSQSGLESLSIEPENMVSAPSFEKLIDATVKESPAVSVKSAPVTAEVQEKIQAGMKVSLVQGGGEVKMKLNPESLGEVRIKLNVASGLVRAEIIVENPEVKRIIEADSGFLRDSLVSHGLTLDKCVVEVGRSADSRGRDGNDPAFSGDEQRPMKDREEKGHSAWHRRFRQDYARQEDGGVDFFI